MNNTKTTIADLIIPTYIGNASGAHDTSVEQLNELQAISKMVTLKTTTLNPRSGNVGKRYEVMAHGSIQSMGLPNMGLIETLNWVEKNKRSDLILKVSVSGHDKKECAILVQAFQNSGVDLIEVNVSCPNLNGDLPIACNLKQLDELLSIIAKLGNKPLGLKLPYYGYVDTQKRLIDLLCKHEIKFLTAINSMLGLDVDIHFNETLIQPNQGQGGVGGTYIQPFALREIWNYHKIIPSTMSIIGVGGIRSGVDAYKFLLAGADFVEVATTLEVEGVGCLKRIAQELSDILAYKNISLDEVKGSLKVCSD